MLLPLLVLVALASAQILPPLPFIPPFLNIGLNNITDCGNPDDILQWETLKVSPQPEKGKSVGIVFNFTLKDPGIPNGTLTRVQIRYNRIKVADRVMDTCMLLDQVHRQYQKDWPQGVPYACPIEPQTVASNVSGIHVPDTLPSGLYDVRIRTVYEEQQVMCLQALYRL